jgi:peptidoglycan/xylan/chitin deacetylase (PgdA/CDA1 family)
MKYRVSLSVDVEDWYHTPAVCGSSFSFYRDVPDFMARHEGRFDFLSEPVSRTLSLLAEFDLHITFFLVADILDYYPGLIDTICAAGHEIGCHGLHHTICLDPMSKKPIHSREQFLELTGTARLRLQQATGQSISGYRAPGAYFGSWMPAWLTELGFSYDSSFCPNSLYNKTDLDFSQVPVSPFKVETPDGFLMELPLAGLDLPGFRVPDGGGPFLRFLPNIFHYLVLARASRRYNTSFYFHAIDISEERLPALASRNKKRPGYFLTSGRHTAAKLRNILHHFSRSFVSCYDLFRLNADTSPVIDISRFSCSTNVL